MKERLTIVVSGMIAGVPFQGGATWAVLQYVLGFRNLGHDVYFVEPLDPSALLPSAATLTESENARYFCDVMENFRLKHRSALLLRETGQTIGLPYADLQQIAQRADVLVNISGMLDDEAFVNNIPIRVYLDLDPAFTQLWHTTQNIGMRLPGHTHHMTIGTAIGSQDCSVPTCGVKWITTLQPIVLKHWPVADGPNPYGITTVANWRGYGSIEHLGVLYGQKVHSMRPLIALPGLAGELFTLALAIHPGEERDLAALRTNAWRLVDPRMYTDTPAKYQRFIQCSKSEFGVAKTGYVLSRCGWFSDRSICYLASGRPVIAQETGFSRFLPAGEGLFAFQTLDDVLASIDALRADYRRHSAAARDIAVEYFDSDRILTNFLERVRGTA